MKRIIALVCLAILSGTVTAAAQNFNFPGGVADLKLSKQHPDLPEIKYGIREPVIIDMNTHWRVLVGLSLQTLPGEYVLYTKHAGKDVSAQHEKFEVRQLSYPYHDEQTRSLHGLRREHDSFSSIDFSNTQQPQLPLRYPIQGKWDDYFGHTLKGVDSEELVVQNLVSLTTTELLSVIAPQNAIISKIDTNEAQISTIYLDHGRGLYSIISGVSDLSVEAGNGVVAGAVIGKLPSNSSNGEPKQLTWQSVLNGVYVNPIILTQL